MNGPGKLFVPLRLTPGTNGVTLRSLRGADEMTVENTGTKILVSLLESLIQPEANGKNIGASQIVTADRDRLLAQLYISLYGAKIESTLSCRECGQKFDLDFSLDKLLDHYHPVTDTLPPDGRYQLEPGICFRLPNGEDEMLINGFGGPEAEKHLLERCLLEGNPETDNEKVQSKMAELAPVLSVDMQATCPECNHAQQVQFDMQTFFLTKLKQERPVLIREVHSIASQYHWSQQEILDLPRSLRKQYAALIQSEN